MPSRSSSRSGSEADADALFRLPPGEFTAARNALAARLKKAGRGEEAERIKGLTKPSVSAWAVNQLYWHHRKAFDELLSVGERFRNAQAAQLAGKAADLRGPLEARREALSKLARLAADTLRGVGHTPAPDMMRRITTTLEAISAYGVSADGPPAGRLVDDVDPPGFETLAALVPRMDETDRGGRSGPPSVLPFRMQAQKARPRRAAKGVETEEAHRLREEEERARAAAAKAAVHEAERALREARTSAERAEAALKQAAARTKEAEKIKLAAEQQLEKAAADANEARQHGRRVAAEAEQAAQAVEDAERALEKARKDLEAIGQ